MKADRTRKSRLCLPLIPHLPFLIRAAVALAVAAALSACGTTGKSSRTEPAAGGGGYYLDDGPDANPPPNLAAVPDAVPRNEPLHRGTLRPYTVMGRSYTPMTQIEPYKARGTATWYGRRYHGKQTSSGEIYDMYAMTAAHPILPIPSYVRVTNLANGNSVVVRVNDRGPFIGDRLIDLSYVAAYKLGYIGNGSAMVEVESVIPGMEAPPPAPVASAPPLAVAPELPPVATPLPEPVPAAVPAAPAAPPVAADLSGIYLQLGAFSSEANAENYLARLKLELGSFGQPLRVVSRDGLYRVHAGPYSSETQARETAARLAQTLGTKPFVINR
jgi:rare lipoprotein A